MKTNNAAQVKPENDGVEAAPVERLVIHDYIMRLKEPVTVDEMKVLIGEKFPVLDTAFSCGKEVISADHLQVTSVKFPIDVETGLSDGVVQIYNDYYIDGKIKYNAWTGIKGVQRYIKKYLNV